MEDLSKYEKYPVFKNLLEMCYENVEYENEVISTLDFKSDASKEYECYKQRDIVTAEGSDCSRHFVNIPNDGMPPSSYGDWTTLYRRWETESAIERLEYFLVNDIFTLFRFRTNKTVYYIEEVN